MTPLSVVVPAFNEQHRLPSTVQAILDYVNRIEPPFFELIIVDDGSEDGTAELVQGFSAEHPYVRLLSNPGNRGKGYSVRHGMLEARGEWILSTDADLSTPIEEIEKLFAATGEAVIAIGSRALDRSLIGIRQPWFREYSGRVFNGVMRAVTGLRFRDTQCGFKLFRRDAAREVFRRQQIDGFSFDVEDLFIARRLGLRAVEVPVRWNNAEGTKVSAAKGLESFADLARIRWYDMLGRYR